MANKCMPGKVFTVLSHKEMQIKMALRFHVIGVRIAVIEKTAANVG
jgi:hypothetical protein